MIDTFQAGADLYKKDSKGRARSWRVETDGQGSYRTVAWLVDGEKVVSEWTLCKPKNLGRSNETAPVQQCELEVAALYQKKLDKHYVANVDQIHDERAYFEVQLCEDYEDRIDEIDLSDGSWNIEPKLDGLRGPTTIDGTFSRGGNEFVTVKFISESLKTFFEMLPGLVFDGEVYSHDYHDDFNEIVSSVKREKPTAADYQKARGMAKLYVYDIWHPTIADMGYRQRRKYLEVLIGNSSAIKQGIVVITPTYPISSREEGDRLYEYFGDENYEGAIYKRDDIPYLHKRHKDHLKRKEWVSAEYELLRLEEGSGNWRGAAKRAYCRVEDGTEFKAGVTGKRPFLREVLTNAHAYKTVMVEHFKQLTPDGKPRFGRVKQFFTGQRDD